MMTFDFWYSLAEFYSEKRLGYYDVHDITLQTELYINEWQQSEKSRKLSEIFVNIINQLSIYATNDDYEAKNYLTIIMRECNKAQIKNNVF